MSDRNTFPKLDPNLADHRFRALFGSPEGEVEEYLEQLGVSFIYLLHAIGNTDQAGERFGSRDLALAATHMEDAVMRALRHLVLSKGE